MEQIKTFPKKSQIGHGVQELTKQNLWKTTFKKSKVIWSA